MGKSVNKVTLLGNLGQDPELRQTGSGVAVCNLRIATNESYKDASGEWVERTEWHSAVAWDKLAGVANEYLRKGSPVYIEGSLQTRSYDDKDGNTKYSTEIKVRELVLLSGGNGDDNARGAARGKVIIHGGVRKAEATEQARKSMADDYKFEPDDSLPF